MKLSNNTIFKIIITTFIISSFLNSLFKPGTSLSIILNLYLENLKPFIHIAKESSLAFLIFPPLFSLFNKKRILINKYILLTTFVLFTFLIISFFSNLDSFNLYYYFFFWRWIWPVILSMVYLRSDLFFRNKKFILKLIVYVLVVFSVFTLENILTDSCGSYRCSSIYTNPTTLGINSLCCILISYKLLGRNIFIGKNIFFYIVPAILILISLSLANIVALIFFSVPFVFSKNNITLKINKNLLSGIIICLPFIIVSTYFLLIRGIFTINSDYYKTSFGVRFSLLFNSAFNDDGSLNIFGKPGIYTNIGKIYDSEIGKMSDSLLSTLIGNFGILIIPFIVIITILVINNYLIIFKNNLKILNRDIGCRGLILSSILIPSLGANLFEIYPMGSILACIIFSSNNKEFYFRENLNY